MSYFKVTNLDETTYYIREKLGVGSYLFLGGERALLSDTCNGYGDLRAVAESLAGGREIVVMNTHGHSDHAGGNDQFPLVHIHGADLHMLAPEWQKSQREQLTGYIKKNLPVLMPLIWYLTRKRYTPVETTVKTIEDGHVFDLLGGRQIETLHLPGHSPGSVVLLDKRTKTIYAGDAVNHGLFLFFEGSPTLKSYAETLRRLAKLGKTRNYEHLRISHGDVTFPFEFIGYYADFLERATLQKSKVTNIPNGGKPVYKYAEPGGKFPVKEIAVHFGKEAVT